MAHNITQCPFYPGYLHRGHNGQYLGHGRGLFMCSADIEMLFLVSWVFVRHEIWETIPCSNNFIVPLLHITCKCQCQRVWSECPKEGHWIKWGPVTASGVKIELWFRDVIYPDTIGTVIEHFCKDTILSSLDWSSCATDKECYGVQSPESANQRPFLLVMDQWEACQEATWLSLRRGWPQEPALPRLLPGGKFFNKVISRSIKKF